MQRELDRRPRGRVATEGQLRGEERAAEDGVRLSKRGDQHPDERESHQDTEGQQHEGGEALAERKPEPALGGWCTGRRTCWVPRGHGGHPSALPGSQSWAINPRGESTILPTPEAPS